MWHKRKHDRLNSKVYFFTRRVRWITQDHTMASILPSLRGTPCQCAIPYSVVCDTLYMGMGMAVVVVSVLVSVFPGSLHGKCVSA